MTQNPGIKVGSVPEKQKIHLESETNKPAENKKCCG